MTKWVRKWARNGWKTCKGTRVANRDLLEMAVHLQNQALKLGKVRYSKASREEVWEAHTLCSMNMDKQEGRGLWQ